jgi:hypothetical protein
MASSLRAGIAAILSSAPFLAATGCCSLAGLVCGPDRSDWVQKDFRTPEAALATVREALRRDARLALFESLSESFRARYGLAGSLELEVAIERLQDEVPGLHLLGRSKVEAIASAGADPNRAAFELRVAGRNFRADFVRQAYWELSWRDGEGRRLRDGEFVARGALARSFLADVAVDDVDESWSVWPMARTPRPVRKAPEVPPDVDNLERFAIGYEWKLDDLAPVED